MMHSLPIWQFDVLLLVLVVLFAVVALSIRNLMGAAVVFGAYSFMMCLIWAGMGAVDVAFTEAAVGAGVSTVFIVSTIYNTSATMRSRPGGMAFKLFIGGVVTLTGVFLLSALPDFPVWGDPNSPVNATVAPYYITHTIVDTHVPNVVTSVLADYRGFDTLLETTVVFIACIAIYSILRVDKAKLETDEPTIVAAPRYDPSDSLIVRQASRFMVPFMQLFALYVIAHGHYSPGGGFQGGVILGASLILLAISFDLKFLLRQWSEKSLMLLVATGVFLYAAVGLACMFMGGDYLNYSSLNSILQLKEENMARSHGILLVEIGVGITVMFSMIAIHINLASNGRFDRGL